MTLRLKSKPIKTVPPSRLNIFKKLLTARREAIALELRQATAEFIADETVYSDSADQASAEADKSFALQMKNRDRDILWQIDEALKRIEKGNYGHCDQCEEPIIEARMKAFPFTTLCVDCKTENESQEHRFPRLV